MGWVEVAHLREAPHEHVEGERVRVVRDGHGREDGELCRDPHDAYPEGGDYLCGEVLCAATVLCDHGKPDETTETE